MSRKTKNLEMWCSDNNRVDLLKEWNHERNMSLRFPKEPCKVEYNNPSSVYWICPENHEWESSVVSRTIFNLQCPICHPDNAVLPIGTKYGCLTIIGGFEEYKKDIAKPRIEQFERDKEDFLKGIRKQNSNISSVEFYDDQIKKYKTQERYKCQCKCGQIQYLSEFHFLEKRHRYCSHGKNECGLRMKQRENILASYKREYDVSYYIDYTNSVHESLEILECVDDNYEELYCHQDKRKRGGGTYKIYKKYKCRCYLCGKEQIAKSSHLSINPPSDYGRRAYGGYYSEAYCDCHKISSFQWIVTKILVENKVPYRVEVSFSDLYGVERVNLLRFDFSVLNADGSIKCLIECQGEQHYKPVDEFGGTVQFERQKKNDELKRIYAQDIGIPLYEIPYKSKKYEKVEFFLKSNDVM